MVSAVVATVVAMMSEVAMVPMMSDVHAGTVTLSVALSSQASLSLFLGTVPR